MKPKIVTYAIPLKEYKKIIIKTIKELTKVSIKEIRLQVDVPYIEFNVKTLSNDQIKKFLLKELEIGNYTDWEEFTLKILSSSLGVPYEEINIDYSDNLLNVIIQIPYYCFYHKILEDVKQTLEGKNNFKKTMEIISNTSEISIEEDKMIEDFFNASKFFVQPNKTQHEKYECYLWDDYHKKDIKKEIERLQSLNNHIYTLIDEEGIGTIVPGAKYVNRIGYFISQEKIIIPESGLRYW
jgi:hypothetical protein